MLDIYDGSKQLLSDNPKGLYFLTGPDYGVKKSYIDIISSKYDEVINLENLQSLIITLNQKSIIPRKDSVYVVRYDKEFIKNISNIDIKSIYNLKIPGIILCLYDDDSSEKKLDKYFSDKVIRVNNFSDNIALKHLKDKYPNINSKSISACISLSNDYYEADNFCNILSILSNSNIDMDVDIRFLFGKDLQYSESRFTKAIMDRNINAYLRELDGYEGDSNLVFYQILNTLMTMYKSGNHSNNKLWNKDNIINMFNEVYNQLKLIRQYKYDINLSLSYIGCLLMFKV